MPLVKFFLWMLQFSTKKCSSQNHGGVTKSHCCDSQTVANGFIGNSAVTLEGTLPTFSIQQKPVYLYMSNTTIMIKRMSCDINFKSQEIMSVHTDLHRHKFQSRVSTKFPGQFTIRVVVQMLCEESILLTKMKLVNCTSNWCNFLRLYMFSLLFGNIPHETYNAAVISRCPSCQVTLQNIQSLGLRVCPWEDKAEVAHAISPIWMKLGQFKGVTSKLLHPKYLEIWTKRGGSWLPPLFSGPKPRKITRK